MTVAVVIPCRNEAASIGALLDAVAGQTHTVDEIRIVDDGSTDETVARVREWVSAHLTPPVSVIAGPARGPGAAMNAGIRSTACDVIVRLDGHSVPRPDYVARALSVLDDPGVAVAGGVWLIRPGAATATARAIAAVVAHPIGSGGARYRRSASSLTELATAAPEDVETVPFGVYRRRTWETLGGYDEALVANEDFDFNHRARTTVGRVRLDPRVQVEYLARPTLSALARQYFRYGFWKCQMLRKSPGAWHPRQLAPALLVPWLVISLVAVGLAPGGVTGATALAYPGVLMCAAVWFGLRGVSPLRAAAAVAVVHGAWSVGFWRGVTGPPSTRAAT